MIVRVSKPMLIFAYQLDLKKQRSREESEVVGFLVFSRIRMG